MIRLGFKQSPFDDWIFYKGNVIYVLYTNNLILGLPHKDEVDQAVQDIQDADINITIKVDLQDFL